MEKQPIKVGLVGESPNDTEAFIALWKKQIFDCDIQFLVLIQKITGSQLDNTKNREILRIEFHAQKPDIVIFIRDLDGLKKESKKINKREKWFNEYNKICENKGSFLLMIYELEACLLADTNPLLILYKRKYGLLISQRKRKSQRNIL